MEESFGLAWEDSTTVVQTEEVICGIENEILPAETEEFAGVTEGRQILYILYYVTTIFVLMFNSKYYY